MIDALNRPGTAFFPLYSPKHEASKTLSPAKTSALIEKFNFNEVKSINSDAAAIGFPALHASDPMSVSLLDSLARAKQQGLSVNMFENAARAAAGPAGMYTAMGQLNPVEPEKGSLVNVMV